MAFCFGRSACRYGFNSFSSAIYHEGNRATLLPQDGERARHSYLTRYLNLLWASRLIATLRSSCLPLLVFTAWSHQGGLTFSLQGLLARACPRLGCISSSCAYICFVPPAPEKLPAAQHEARPLSARRFKTKAFFPQIRERVWQGLVLIQAPVHCILVWKDSHYHHLVAPAYLHEYPRSVLCPGKWSFGTKYEKIHALLSFSYGDPTS